MWKSLGLWSFVAYWFLLGFFQSLVLWQRIPRIFASWFLATSLAGVGWLILLTLLLCLLFMGMISTSDIGLAPALGAAGAAYLIFLYAFLVLPLLAAVGGALLGWIQWRVLRHYITRVSIWWELVSVVSWVFGSGLLLYLCFVFKTQYKKIILDSTFSMADPDFTLMMIGLASVGAIGGAIKGGVLAWLLLRPRREF
jgi:hypothetical protein